MPFKKLGTGHLLGHALQNAWDMPALGTCPLKCLGPWDMPLKMPGTCPLKCLGQAISWDMPFKMLGTGPLFKSGAGCQNAIYRNIYIYIYIYNYIYIFFRSHFGSSSLSSSALSWDRPALGASPNVCDRSQKDE